MEKRSAWAFVPSLYFAEGVPYVIINTLSVILYKKMGVDNARIAFWTSLLYLPWAIKMLWGPLVDIHSTKRNWILATQCMMALCLASLSVSMQSHYFFVISMLVFTLGAFISATHDIAADGFYLLALTKENQALFVGIRSLFYRIAMIFSSGLLVYLAGKIEKNYGNIGLSWTITFGLAAVIFAFLTVYHKCILPHPTQDEVREDREKEQISFIEIIKAYFKHDRIWAIIAFIFFYRFGEAMLVKLANPFLLDARTNGGLELTTSQVGLVYGTVGVFCLIIGGISGGWVVSRYGLKKCLWYMALILNVPHVAYLYMAIKQPSVAIAYPLVAIEQFGYGFGFTAYLVYLMYISEGKYKTSFYAISTGLMAFGMMIPGLISGYVQTALGYKLFFVVVLLMGIPGLLTLLFLPKIE